MKIKIRKIKKSDFKKGYLETLLNLAPVDLPAKKAEKIYQKRIKNNPIYNIFVAELENEIVGTITLLIEQKFIHRGGKVAHIEDVVVKRGFERRGIGKALVKAAVEEAKKKNCYKVILCCKKRNVPFYNKFGFRAWETEMRLEF